MTDLIWIGNTLYPRGLVLLVGISILIIIGAVAACIIAFVSTQQGSDR